MAESLRHHPDGETLRSLLQRMRVRRVFRHTHLARVEPVGAGDDLQKQRVVGDRIGHGADVVDG